MLEKYRADVEYVDSKRQQRDTLRKDKPDLGKRIREALRMVEAGEVDAELLYVAEMRRRSVSDISKRCQGWSWVQASLGGLACEGLGFGMF
ncbi:Slc47a1 [Symbiodinium sp. CCMP2592]|nr:Slc47a1 [Symbiodinium sp. CCMP2592]